MAAGLHVAGPELLTLHRRRKVPALFQARCVAWVVLPFLLLCGCSTQPARLAMEPAGPAAGAATPIYVVRRTWHIDIGFRAQDLQPPMASLRDTLPGARYLLFGFGDRQYLLAQGHGLSLLKALLPGPGAILVTGLPTTPEVAVGASHVVRIEVPPKQAKRVQAFVWNSFTTHAGVARPIRVGPYAGSLYYASPQRYSLLHTCNNWAAQALESARLPIHSSGVELAGQLWHQVRQLASLSGGPHPHLSRTVACCRLGTPPCCQVE